MNPTEIVIDENGQDEVGPKGDFSFAAGDFLELYGDASGKLRVPFISKEFRDRKVGKKEKTHEVRE